MTPTVVILHMSDQTAVTIRVSQRVLESLLRNANQLSSMYEVEVADSGNKTFINPQHIVRANILED